MFDGICKPDEGAFDGCILFGKYVGSSSCIEGGGVLGAGDKAIGVMKGTRFETGIRIDGAGDKVLKVVAASAV